MTPTLDIEGPIATLTLRRPEAANKLAPEDLPVLLAHIDTINRQERVLVLALRSTGKHFSAGYDITQIASSQAEGRGIGEMIDAVENCRAVTVAVVQGGVYGGATDMALACDFRIGCEHAQLAMPAARLGLHYYQSGMERYVMRLGLDMAKRLFLTGETLDASAMQRSGFLTHLVLAAELDSRSRELCAHLASMAPIALLGMKQHLNRIARGTADPVAIRASVASSVQSDDLKEGARAWKEGRPPRFTGR